MKNFFAGMGAKLRVIFGAVDWKDVAVRSVKTFVQAFVAAVGVSIASGRQMDTILTSALAAAIAALWNGVLSPVWKAIGQKADEVIVTPETVSTTDGSMVQVEVSACAGATLDEVTAALGQAGKDAAEEIAKG